jgi:DNA-binding winged helix-turn-helix (wHTH) protein/tetratricopeptide (TPR) repeat protein
MLLANKEVIRFGEYTLNRVRWTVLWREEQISLSRKGFDVLLYLIDHRDRVVSKDELLRVLWEGQFVQESNLTQQIFLLRKALSKHESGDKLIETVAGRGYRFAAQVIEPPAELTLNASKTVTEITIEEQEYVDPIPVAVSAIALPGRTRRVWVWTVGLAILLVVAGWFGWQRWFDRSGGQPVDVVLTPIQGSTGDTVLDRTLTEALRMDLGQSPFVTVVAPARVRAALLEMKQKPDDPMTVATAREVCERTNSQAVLRGNVARIGPHFLLTEEVTSCVNGSVLAEAKHEASTTEDLPGSIDRLAESLRRKLGESRGSIARFDVPLLSGDTASLEALKYYTQAHTESNLGKYVDAIALTKKAIAADPNFAEAYYDLAAYYGSTLNLGFERDAILKAYELRDSASEPIRLAIVALYHSSATQDLYEAERNYRNWTELYPRSALAWNGLSVVERDLGYHADALISGQRALRLRPMLMGLYSNVAFEMGATNDLKDVPALCERAIAKGLDADYIRQHYFEAAYALHDAELVQKQRDWAAAHPDAVYIRADEIEVAISEGRFSDALRLIPQLLAIMRRQGLTDAADDFLRAEGINLIESGAVIEGARLIRSAPVDPKSQLSVVATARVGDFAAAETALHTMQAEFPQGTLWNDYRGPEVEAIIALDQHKPKTAIAALERARPLEGREPFLIMVRGDAYLANGEPALAEQNYRRVTEGPMQVPDIEEIPLSWLGLGRALAAEGKRPAAIEAYKHFLALWNKADPDAKFLIDAKNEFKAL